MSIRLYIPINRIQKNSRKELETKITWRADRMSSTWDLSPPLWPLWCWINISIKRKVMKILSTPKSQQCTWVFGYVTISIWAKITTLGVVWAQGKWMTMLLVFIIWKRIRKKHAQSLSASNGHFKSGVLQYHSVWASKQFIANSLSLRLQIVLSIWVHCNLIISKPPNGHNVHFSRFYSSKYLVIKPRAWCRPWPRPPHRDMYRFRRWPRAWRRPWHRPP